MLWDYALNMYIIKTHVKHLCIPLKRMKQLKLMKTQRNEHFIFYVFTLFNVYSNIWKENYRYEY